MKVSEKQIKNLDPKKIYSIKQRVGLLAESTKAKYYKCTFNKKPVYYIALREGILKYFGCAQKSVIYGTKNKHFKEFKTATGLANYINKLE